MSLDEKEQLLEQLLADKDVAVESVEDVKNQEEVCENLTDFVPCSRAPSVLLFVSRRNR
jgi:hypothetical protein